MKMNKCDMCGAEISNEQCLCGIWKSAEEMKDNPIKNGIIEFHNMQRFTLTCDAPHMGVAVVYFRGDYNDTQKVQKFIYEMKGRPYYED